MPKTNRAYKSAKRSKELDRQKKRDEKIRRRLAAKSGAPVEGEEDGALTDPEDEIKDIVPGEDPDSDPIIPRD